MSPELQMIVAACGVVGTLVGGFWAVLRVAGNQFERRLDDRFRSQDKAREEGRSLWVARLVKVEEDHRELEREFLKHLADLPREYMRREDHIRFETVIFAKLDALAAQQALLAERLPTKGTQ